MIRGYARVSSDQQTTALQLDALERAGCEHVYQDQGVSGVKARPQLGRAIEKLAEGDVLVVWRLDRLGRSLADLIRLVQLIESKGAGFRSLTESIDTTTASGRLVFHVMGALAEFERALLLERTRAGLAAAKRRGTRLGRAPAVTPEQLRHYAKLVSSGESVRELARAHGMDPSTLYRHLARAGT